MAGHVFISYSRADRPYVDRLTEHLTRAGIPVWYDYEIATGDRWAQVIQEQIDAAAAFLVVMSPASAESDWVNREISYAMAHGKPIFPLLLAGGQRFFMLADRQYEDVTGGRLPAPSFVNRIRDTLDPAVRPVSTSSEPDELPATAATRRSLQVLTGHTSWVGAVSWSPDDRLVATGGGDGTLRIWDVTIGGAVRVVSGHARELWSVAWSPGGTVIATGGRDGTVRLWLVETGELAGPPLTDQHDVRSIAWSPDQGTLAIAGTHGVMLCDAATGRPRLRLAKDIGTVRSVAWAPHGRQIVTGGVDGVARIWDTGSSRLATAMAGHRGLIGSVAWSPDGSRIATASSDRTARIWDAVSGQELIVLSGHVESVNGVAWAPDGADVATASDDGTAQVWDAVIAPADRAATARARLKRVLPGHLGPVRTVAYSPNGRLIATAATDRTARIWANRPG